MNTHVEIKNMHRLDKNKISITYAPITDYPIIQNMGRFYVYDMSEYMGDQDGWQMPEDGLYECMEFKKYWEADHTFTYLIRYADELAGFAIVDNKGSDASIDYNMAQFFILRKFKNKGLGRYVAQELFDLHRGVWEIMVMPGNHGAFKFWKSTVISYGRQFMEYSKVVPHLSSGVKDIFKFDSRGS